MLWPKNFNQSSEAVGNNCKIKIPKFGVYDFDLIIIIWS